MFIMFQEILHFLFYNRYKRAATNKIKINGPFIGINIIDAESKLRQYGHDIHIIYDQYHTTHESRIHVRIDENNRICYEPYFQ
jgi:hypothetical protein